MKNIFNSWRRDLPASIVVFFVALPLCLGIGLASTSVNGIPPMPLSGLISGIIGGVIVGLISNSRLGVSGPAAGLITVVLSSITLLGSFEFFLSAVMLAGVFQLLFALLRAGIIANYLPSGVIKGMLAAIGITLILKEIPHLIGYDKDYIGDESFLQNDGHNTILWVIILGTLMNILFASSGVSLEIAKEHMVQIPEISSIQQLLAQLHFPALEAFTRTEVYWVALTIAAIASLETLLSVEAIDRLDPKKSITNPNRELLAQGVGNFFTGLIGGIPVTQVIVRSTANLNSGGESKSSAILHGFWLLLAILLFAPFLNKIPLATLAAILISVGYKLTNFNLIKNQFSKGWDQFIPFFVTIIAILFTDLLKGIGIGLVVAIFYIIKKNYWKYC